MSRPPNSNGSNREGGGGGAAAFNTSTHLSRASTHSIPVSYAYGAPSIGTPKSPQRGSPSTRGHHRGSSRIDDGASVVSDGTGLGAEESEQGTASNEGTGRAREPAPVRYARIAQRKKDTGAAFPNTLAAGPSHPLAPPPPASNQQPPATFPMINNIKAKPSLASSNDTSVNIATAFAQAVAGNAAVPARREVQANGLATREREDEEKEDEDEEEEYQEEEEEQESSNGKETHTASRNDGSKKRKKRSSGKDPSFKHRAGETESDDESSEDGLERKRAKKDAADGESGTTTTATAPSTSKKASSSRRKSGDPTYRPVPTSGAESEEFSEDDRSRRRRSKGKGRASQSGSASTAINIGRRDGEVWYNKNGKKRKGRARRSSGGEGASGFDEGEDGYGNGEHEGRDESYDQEGYEPPQDDFQPQHPTSFYLRPATPPSGSANGNVESSPGAHPPFDLDPSFAAFDKSINSSFNRSGSLDDSGVQGSSYDYSEEERIVAALEQQMSQQKNAQAGGSGLRKRNNRLPGPPGPPALRGIQEEDEQERGGSFGRKLARAIIFVWSSIVYAWRILMDPALDWYKIGKTGGVLFLVLLVLSNYLFSRPTPTNSTTHRFIDFVPFLSRPPTYSAPELPPDSFTVLVNRLTLLESALGQLSTLTDSQRTLGEKDHSLLDKVSKQVTNLQDGFEQERQRTTKALESNKALGSKSSQEVDRVIKGVKADLESLVSRVKGISDDQKTDKNDIRHLQIGINNVGKEIASLGTKVAQVAKDAEAGANAERIAKIALEAIEARLPSRLAVHLGPAGKLEIDPAFWKYLKEAFAEKKEVANLVSSKVSSELAKRPPSSSSGSPSISKQPSWQDFLVSNEASLRSWVESDISSRLSADAVVSKKTFLDILHREIKQLKVDFETKANENVQKIGEELLSKVAKQEQMKKDIPASRRPSSTSPQQITIKSSDGTNISDLIESLVDTALIRYSKDVLAKPDYALYTSGGRVIPSLTSPTYEVRPVGLTPKILGWITGIKSIPGRPPVIALHPDNGLGSCWPFAGSHGQLGILLSRRVVPTDITIEHASVDVALDGDVASAPKDFEVWGVVEGQENLERLKRFRQEQAESNRRAVEAGLIPEDGEPPASLGPTPNHILLAASSYDTSATSPIQTFPVTASARQLGIPVSIVVVKILSNHGDTTLTCLYRVRVSGISETVAASSPQGVAP